MTSSKQSRITKQAASQRAAERAAAIRREQEAKERRRRNIVVAVVLVVVLAVVGGIAYAVQAGRDTTGQAGAAPSGADGYTLPVGKAGAPTLTIYEDPICPYCGQFEAASRSWVSSYLAQGKVRIKYHLVDFLNRNSTTAYSQRAGNAIAAAYDQSGPDVAKKLHDLVYENQPAEGGPGLSDDQLLSYAVKAGADKAAMSKAISDKTFFQWITNSTDEMSKNNVTGTPTVFFGDTAAPSGLSMQQLSDWAKQQVDS